MKHLPFFLVLVLVGCNNRPAEMPSALPCKIIIVNGGVPQVGYSIALYSHTGNGSMSIMADTDSSGVAEIRTRLADYTTKGAPIGTYKVTVEKHVPLPPDGVDTTSFFGEELNAYLAKRAEEAEKLRVVPIPLTRMETTPFEIKLEPGGTARWTFDLKEYTKYAANRSIN